MTNDQGTSLRWWICGMLLAATAISYIDRQTLSFVSPLVAQEFGLTNEQLGRVLSAFLLAYTFGQLLAGRFFDAVGSRCGNELAALTCSSPSSLM